MQHLHLSAIDNSFPFVIVEFSVHNCTVKTKKYRTIKITHDERDGEYNKF